MGVASDRFTGERIGLGVTLLALALHAAAAGMLEDTDWSLERLPDQDKSLPASAAREVAVRFEGGRVSGYSGCNQFIGTYTIEGDRVTVGPLAGTMMACLEAAMTLERALQRALTGTLRYTIDGDRLTLTQASGASLLLARSRPRDIESTSWEVTGFNNGRHAVVSPLLGTTLVLTFRGGEIEGFGGCNAFSGSFTRNGNRLTIGPLAVARMQCGGKGVTEQELEFLAALRSAATWVVRGGLLDLHRADGSRALTARVRGE